MDKLLDELISHLKTGTREPKQLMHYETSPWSRRLTESYRLIYRILEDRVVVLFFFILRI
jgi:Txe/YoeB family toxin of Txe-Axe toxin-antitoxin module